MNIIFLLAALSAPAITTTIPGATVTVRVVTLCNRTTHRGVRIEYQNGKEVKRISMRCGFDA